MRVISIFLALALPACLGTALDDAAVDPHAGKRVDRRVAHIPHAQTMLADLDAAAPAARRMVPATHLRVLFVSPVNATNPFAATGGQRNSAFLCAGAARLGMEVATFIHRGQTAEFLATQEVAIHGPPGPAYVAAGSAAALRAEVARFARALDAWRRTPAAQDVRAEVFSAYEAATALLTPKLRAASDVEARVAFPHDDALRRDLQRIVYAQQLAIALAAHRAEVCVVDLGDDALAAILAIHDGDTALAWYVQNAGTSPEDAIVAQHASVLACSPSALAAKQVLVALPRPSYVVPNGIAAARFANSVAAREQARQALKLPPDAFVVGQVGYVDANKDQATTLRAFAALRDEVSDAVLLFVGGRNDWAYAKQLDTLVQSEQVGDHVRFLGDVDDVATVLPALDVVVSASRQEGYGLSVAEAMAAARPVVLTAIPPFEALGGEAALYFAPGNAAGLTEALRRLLDPAARACWGGRAQERVYAVGADNAEMLASFGSVLVELGRQRFAR